MNSEVTYLKGEGRINFEGTCINVPPSYPETKGMRDTNAHDEFNMYMIIVE